MKVYHRAEGEVQSWDDKTTAMFEWAQSIGVKLNPKLKYPVRFVPGYIGVQTSEDLGPCEELLSAPNAAMLSTKLMNHPELEVVYSQHPKFFSLPDRAHEDNRMIVYCLWQQSLESESFWSTYLRFLPKDVETIIDWNDSELDELQDKDFEYDSRFRRDRDFKGNAELGEILKGFPLMFKAEYLELNNINWIWKILCTRSYGRCIPFNALIPIADLFNHDNVNTVYFYALQTESTPDANNQALETDYEDADDPLVESAKPLLVSSLKLLKLCFAAFEELTAEDKEKHAELLTQARVDDSQAFVKSKSHLEMETATKSAQYGAPAEEEDYRFRITVSKFETFEAGSQVCIPYGKYSNRQLLTNYGFVLNENIYNYARTKFLLKDFLTETQIERLPKGFNPDMEIIFKLKAHEFCIELIKVIRVFNWDVKRNSSNAFFHPADFDLEICCLEKFIAMLGEVYGRFGTILEQDLEIIGKAQGKLYFAVRKS